MRAVLWAAVSSKPQLEGDSIDVQLADARRFASDAHLAIVAELTVPGHSRDYIFFTDAARDMDAYSALYTLCQKKAFDVLVCRARDRLGRTDALCAQVEALVTQAGAQVYSINAPTPLGNGRSEGDLYVAAFERARAQADVQRLVKYHAMGMRALARSGRPPTAVPYGYRRVGKGRDATAEVVPEQAAVFREIIRLYLLGWGVRRLAAYLDGQGIRPDGVAAHWQQKTVGNMVASPFYVGWTYYDRHKEDGVIAKGSHEPLIDEVTWQAVQAEAARRRALHSRGNASDKPFSGVVRCRRCGRAMEGVGLRHDGRVSCPHYRCASRAKSKRDCHYNHTAEKRIRAAFAALQKELLGAGGMEAALSGLMGESPDSEDRLGEIAQERVGLTREGERLTVAYVRGVALSLEEFEKEKSRIDVRLRSLEMEENALRHRVMPDMEGLRADLEVLAWLDLDRDPAQSRAILTRRVTIWCEERRVVEVQLRL